ncbi:MAG: phosphatase PAP2 family protein [Flavobacteriaceae bacterium]|nr:phosphatase PAP2 family protein [Flavobacteriaceae bacterium]
MQLLKKIDLLFFGYIGISTVLLLISWNQSENSLNLLVARVVILSAVTGLIYASTKVKSTFIHLLRNTYPILLSMYFYSKTVFYNKFLFDNFDPYLIKLEEQIFGFQPSQQFSTYFSSKLFSELMYMGYFSFYILIIGFVLYTYFKKKNDFNELAFKLAASMLIFYLIFGIFPSAGPQFYFSAPESTAPTAYVFDTIMQFIIKNGDQPTGAFPSSHVGISVILLLLSRKKAPNYFKKAWPFVILLTLSTVYIKAHYAIDAIAGIIIAPVILYFATWLYNTSFKNNSTR